MRSWDSLWFCTNSREFQQTNSISFSMTEKNNDGSTIFLHQNELDSIAHVVERLKEEEPIGFIEDSRWCVWSLILFSFAFIVVLQFALLLLIRNYVFIIKLRWWVKKLYWIRKLLHVDDEESNSLAEGSILFVIVGGCIRFVEEIVRRGCGGGFLEGNVCYVIFVGGDGFSWRVQEVRRGRSFGFPGFGVEVGRSVIRVEGVLVNEIEG